MRNIVYITGPDPGETAITRWACVNPPAGVQPEDLTEQDCIDNPLDLEGFAQFADNAVQNPEVCCGEITTPGAVARACEIDCAYAACNLAVLKLKEAAEKDIPDLTKADFIAFSEFLGLPANQDACAEKVVEAAPGVMAWVLGEAMSDHEFGHIEQLTLKLQCNVTETVE